MPRHSTHTHTTRRIRPRFRAEDAAALLNGRRRGAGFQIPCPVHDDRNPSAAIYQRDDGSLAGHCFAGCDFRAVTDAVYAALGIRPGFDDDLPPPPAPAPPPDNRAGRRRPHTAPPPRRRGYTPYYKPPPGCELLPGTGWPNLYDGQTPYALLLDAIADDWTAWTPYQLADGAPRHNIRRFPRGAGIWDSDKGRPTSGLQPRIWLPPKPGAPLIYILVEGEKAAAAVAALVIGLRLPYGVISIPGTSHYARADYSAFAGAAVIILPDGDGPRRRKETREIIGLPVGWTAAQAGANALTAAGAHPVVVPPLEMRRAARAAGMPVSGADAADGAPLDIAEIIADAVRQLDAPNPRPTPAPPPVTPPRPYHLQCEIGSGMTIRSTSANRKAVAIIVECRCCAACREWRRQLIAARFDAGRAAGTVGAMAYIAPLPTAAAAAALRKAENAHGGARWTAISRTEDDAAFALRIVYLDALDADAADLMRRRIADRGLPLPELESAVYIGGEDIARWTPDARRYYPDGAGGWLPHKPDDWQKGQGGAINAVGFSRNWPARAYRPDIDYGVGPGRLVKDGGPALIDTALAEDRRMMPRDDYDALAAYKWRDGVQPPAPALWTALCQAEGAGDAAAAQAAARALCRDAGIGCKPAMMRGAARPRRHCDYALREWALGLAQDADPPTAAPGRG